MVLLLCCHWAGAAIKDEEYAIIDGFKYEYQPEYGRFMLVMPVIANHYTDPATGISYTGRAHGFTYLHCYNASILSVLVDGSEKVLVFDLKSYAEDKKPWKLCYEVSNVGTFKGTSDGDNLKAGNVGAPNTANRHYAYKNSDHPYNWLDNLILYWYPPIDMLGKTIQFKWSPRIAISKAWDSKIERVSTSAYSNSYIMPSWPFFLGSVSLSTSFTSNEKSGNTVDTRYFRNKNDNCTTAVVFQRYVTYASCAELDDFIKRGGKFSVDGKQYTPGDVYQLNYIYALEGDSKKETNPKTIDGYTWHVEADFFGNKKSYDVHPSFKAYGIPCINWLNLKNTGDGFVELSWSSGVENQPVVIQRSFDNGKWETIYSGNLGKNVCSYVDNGLPVAAQAANSYGKVYYRASLKYHDGWLWKEGSKYATESIVPEIKHKYVTSVVAVANDAKNKVIISIDNTTNHVWSNKSEVQLERMSNNGGSWTKIATMPYAKSDDLKYTIEYTDSNNVDNCVVYQYRARVEPKDSYFGNQEDVLSDRVTPSNTKGFTHISASKGYYNNYVEIQWEIDGAATFTEFEIKRKLATAGSNEWITIENMARKDGSTQKVFRATDQSCLPGVVYDYKVTGISNCGTAGVIEQSTDIETGFRSPTGAFTGRVTYGSGQAVDSVYVRARTSDNIESYAMSFDGNKANYLAIDDASLLQYTNPDMTLQAWVNATNKGGQIISKGSMFKLYLTNGKPCFEYGGNKVTASVSVTGEYKHVTAVADYKGKSMAIYIDGELNVSAKITKSVNPVSDKIKIGSEFKGEIDEVRIWSKALSANSISQDYMRYLAPGKEEDGLEAYYTFNFVSNGKFYDCSSSGNGIYNGRDGSINGNVGKSVNVPSTNQLSYMAITDNDGKYNIIGVPYLGNGTTYTIEPQKGTHVFNPNNEVRFINESASNHTINFTDESSFTVSGNVYYENTTYPVEGVGLYVDGLACSLDNDIVKTKADGSFEISVPIGSHYISLEMPNHTFVNGGRYPEDPNNVGTKHVFVKDMSNLVFYDNTYVTLAGRVVGGDVESAKKIGLGQSKANIGKATITLKLSGEIDYNLNTLSTKRTFESASEYVNSTAEYQSSPKSIVIITTDSKTGEYAVKLPPIDFTVYDVSIANNKDNINLGNSSTWEPIKLSEMTGKTTTDTAVVDGKTATFEYNDNFSVTYHATPKLELSQMNVALKGAFGESEISYKDEVNDIDTVIELYSKVDEEIKYAFSYPIFTQDKKYAFKLYAYEEYNNYDDGDNNVETDRLPLSGTVITIDNALSAYGVVVEPETDEYSVGDVVLNSNQIQLDSAGRYTYVFKAGFPNINGDHTLGLNISYDYDGKTYTSWSNDGGWNGTGIVFGGVMMGNNFVTAGPDNVHFVLRDPPGSGSSASLEEGTTITTTNSYAQSSSSAGNSTLTTFLGVDTEIATGIGVMVIEELSVTDDFSVGTETETAINQRNEMTSTMTLTERVCTSGEMNYVGSAGDVFIGKSTNIVYGGQRTVGLKYDNENENEKFIIDLGENYAGSVVFGTEFKYTQNYIENVLIPNWRTLSVDLLNRHRINNLPRCITVNGVEHFENLRNYSVYYSLVSKEDPNFGTDGYYIFMPPTDENCAYTVSCVDSVKWYQSQASYWEGVLAENEKQKVLAISSEKDYNEAEYEKAITKFNYVREAYKMIASGEHDLDYYLHNSFKAPFTEKEYNMYVDALKTTNEADIPCTLYYDSNKYGFKVANYSFDSGTSFEKTVEYGSSIASEYELDYTMSVVLSNTVGFEFNGLGEQWEIGTTQSNGYTNTSSSSTETTTAVGFELREDGDDDAITVDVFMAPDGFGPIFYTRAGQTSCPYEGEELTKYYEPGQHKLAEATMQIEKPSIFVEDNKKSFILTGIPAGDMANFTIALNNESEIHEDIWYLLMIEDATNPYGAKVTVDGKALVGAPLEVLVPAGETVYKTLSVEQSRIDVLDYENIGIILASSCQYDGTDIFDVIADTIHVSVKYVPSCSDVTLQIENPIVNTNFSNAEDEAKLKVVMKDYNVNFSTFKYIRLQYKGEGDANWNTVKEFKKDSLDAESGSENYTVDMSNFSDQKYQFRAVTVCQFGNEETYNESETIEVVKDMSKPASLGAPSPINGILTNDNEVYVQFNEQIQPGKLHADLLNSNIVVEGVLNGYELDHATALNLQGDEAYTEASIDLSDRDFTFEMWLNYTKPGTLIEHGVGQNRFKAEITDDNKLRLTMGEKVITSDNALLEDYWMYLAISYDKSHETVNASYAYDAATVNLFENEAMASYSGNGPLTVGKGMNVKMHELTLWDETRNFVTSTSEMNTAKYPSTWNLIGYWPLDEGKGTVGADNARSRNLVLPANAWYLNNVNFAASFNGDNSYIKVNTSSIPVKDEQDYAVEFWFRAESAGTLFSAGDSLLAVGFDADKSMYIVADGKKSQVTAANYVDNTWHHFALNVLRNGTSAIYIDGNVAKQLVSSNVPALAASDLVIGAMGNYEATGLYSGNMVYRDFFKGQVDEFRIWNATMTASALRMNIDNRISGDEPGLVAYYPFENTYVDSYNQNVTEYSTIDYVTSAKHDADPSSAVLYADNVNVESTSQAPALKEARNVESVSFGYVASDTKIVINVTEDAARIEGRTLEFTVKNVIDANGNYCEPIHWTAYVNRNQLKWADNSKSIKKELYDNYEFSVNIVNQSGNLENWTMTNLPTWLHASKTSGTLAALSSETIKFTVEESTPIGKYEETVYLTGNNNIDEPFVVSLHVTGQKPEWNVNASDFEYAMSIVGTMSINGKLSEDSEDILAAYANGRLVGVCSPKYYERYDAYYLMMSVYGDSVVGDKLTFKIFDASTGINYPVVTSSKDIIFRQGALEGNMTAPVSFVAADKREQQIDLKAGWNWMSMNVVPDALSTNSIFADLDHDIKIVKSKTDGFMKENNANMSVQNMYKVRMGKSSVLTLTGASVDVANTPVSVNSGWNWIGYLPQASMDVNSALAALAAQNGDVIKSQTQFALYDGYEWVGSLEYLRPGSGYVYLSNADSTISFKYPQSSVMGADNSKSGSDLNFVVNDALFSGNMTMIAKVMDGLSELDNVEVGVFAGDVCRGAARAKDGKYYLTIAGNEQPDALKFRIYFIDADSIVEIDQNLKYAEDAMIGFDSPYIIQLGDDVVVSSVAVCTMPIKTQYVVGENLDLTGGSISVSYSNAAVDTLDMLASMVYGYDKTLAGVQTLVVAFQSISTTMQVIVNEKVEEPTLVCVKLLSLPKRTVYNIGDELDVNGGQIMAIYSNGVTDTIEMTPDMVRGFNSGIAGLQSLMVFYSNAYDTYSVSVVDPLDIITNEANVKIYGSNRVIIVESAQIDNSDICVFNVEGRMIMKQKSAGTRTEISMERQGIYIVRFGDIVERVVLY